MVQERKELFPMSAAYFLSGQGGFADTVPVLRQCHLQRLSRCTWPGSPESPCTSLVNQHALPDCLLGAECVRLEPKHTAQDDGLDLQPVFSAINPFSWAGAIQPEYTLLIHLTHFQPLNP